MKGSTPIDAEATIMIGSRLLSRSVAITIGLAAVAAPGMAGAPPADRPIAIGPLRLGMAETRLEALLGTGTERTDRSGSRYMIYVFPRDLKARLARRPRPAEALQYSTLVVLIDRQRIAAFSLTAGSIGAVPDALRVFPLDARIDAVGRRYGPPARWNSSHDEAFFEPSPLSMSVDDAGRVFAVTAGRTIAEQRRLPSVALTLSRRPGSRLINGFGISAPS